MSDVIQLIIGAILFTALFGSYGLVIYLGLVIAIRYYTKEVPTK